MYYKIFFKKLYKKSNIPNIEFIVVMKILSVLPVLILIILPFSSASYVSHLSNISFTYDDYGNIYNLAYNGTEIIDEIKFSQEIEGTWVKTMNDVFYTNGILNLRISSIGIIYVNPGDKEYIIEIPEEMNVTRAVTFDGIITDYFTIRFSGFYTLDQNIIESNSTATIFLNESGNLTDEISSPDVGGVLVVNGSFFSNFVYVNSSVEKSDMTFRFSFNGSPEYFIFIFQGKNDNFDVFLNGKPYGNYTVFTSDNSTFYKVLVPPGNNTVSFANIQTNYSQNVIAVAFITASIVLGIITLYVVRRR